jgi:hypothetical protein
MSMVVRGSYDDAVGVDVSAVWAVFSDKVAKITTRGCNVFVRVSSDEVSGL